MSQNPVDFFKKALMCIQNGDYPLALANLDLAIGAYPDFFLAYSKRGYVYDVCKHDYHKAISDYDSALAISHEEYEKQGVSAMNVAEVYNFRGLALRKTGNAAEALASYSKAIEKNPDYDAAYHNRGFLHETMGKIDLAVSDYSSAIKLNPQYAKAYNNRGILYARTGNTEQAISDYENAIKFDPVFAEPHYNIGILYAERKELKKALRCFETAIKLKHDYALAHLNLAAVYSQKKDFIRSTIHLRTAYSLDPNHPDIRRAVLGY
jgi:tetratricopeptide (TPR) repeat protein